VSHAINIFAVPAHPRRNHVTGTHSTARVQTSTYSPELWWAVQMRTTTIWTVALAATTTLPYITMQASNQLSPLSSRWVFKFRLLLSVCTKLYIKNEIALNSENKVFICIYVWCICKRHQYYIRGL